MSHWKYVLPATRLYIFTRFSLVLQSPIISRTRIYATVIVYFILVSKSRHCKNHLQLFLRIYSLNKNALLLDDT